MEFEKSCQQIEFELTDKFLDKKYDTHLLVESYRRLGLEERANRVFFCGTDLDFRIPADYSDSPKLYRANFCKDRLCGMCTWRRSLKVFGQVSQVMDLLEKDYAFVFVTFTLRSCSASELKRLLDHLQKGFETFRHRKRAKQAFKGCFKAIELTHDLDKPKQHQYHPHIHCIYAVRKGYFKGKEYITQSELKDLWRDCCGIDYDPVVDIRKVKPDVGEEGISHKGAVAEVATYTVKSVDIFRGSEDQIDAAVETLLGALSSRRLCSFTGVFKEAARKLKLDDLTDGDLVNTDNQKVRSDVGWLIVKYKWQVGCGYVRECAWYEESEEKE